MTVREKLKELGYRKSGEYLVEVYTKPYKEDLLTLVIKVEDNKVVSASVLAHSVYYTQEEIDSLQSAYNTVQDDYWEVKKMEQHEIGYKYQVVFVDEYNNWYLIGFFNDLKDAEPRLNSYLETYMAMDEDGNELDEPYEFGDDKNLGHLETYPSTLGSCFDRVLSVDCGSIEIRGFVF